MHLKCTFSYSASLLAFSLHAKSLSIMQCNQHVEGILNCEEERSEYLSGTVWICTGSEYNKIGGWV